MTNYKLIAEKGNYALIQRGSKLQQYAVISGLNKEAAEWDWTCCYYDFVEPFGMTKEKALFKALDFFLSKTDDSYIPYDRLLGIADHLKSGLIEDGEAEAYEFMCDTVELTEDEAKALGLDMGMYKKYSDRGDNERYTPSSTCGDYSPSHPWDAPGMSIKDFI